MPMNTSAAPPPTKLTGFAVCSNSPTNNSSAAGGRGERAGDHPAARHLVGLGGDVLHRGDRRHARRAARRQDRRRDRDHGPDDEGGDDRAARHDEPRRGDVDPEGLEPRLEQRGEPDAAHEPAASTRARPMTSDSPRTEAVTWRRLAPTARSSASSRFRCATMIEKVLKMRNEPTNREISAKISRNVLKKLSAWRTVSLPLLGRRRAADDLDLRVVDRRADRRDELRLRDAGLRLDVELVDLAGPPERRRPRSAR